jgi:hypothetical protein
MTAADVRLEEQADVRLEEQEDEDEEVTADWERRKRKTKERKTEEQQPDGPRPAERFRRAETPRSSRPA